MKRPYYIVAPPYDEKSAGNRVLYALASTLRQLGEEAYVVIHEQWDAVWATVPDRYDVVPLTAIVARRHYEEGRAPICVYPEITRRVPDCGFKVLYLLSDIGAVPAAADLLDYDFVLSYSATIARNAPRSDMVGHIPVSDPDYWSPDPHARRVRPAVYAGKYVDLYGQQIPADLAGATVIQRHGLGAPTRAELRDIFRTSTHLYVFESTAVAAEAVLCGCPVVYRTNAFFNEHVGEGELGLAGFTTSDQPDALAEASASTAIFRANFRSVMAQVDSVVCAFIDETQMRAVSVTISRPFPVRPLSSIPGNSEHDIGRFTSGIEGEADTEGIVRHQPTDRDIRFSYWLFLAREPESMAAIRGKRGLTATQLAGTFVDSDEFARRIIAAVCRGEDVDVPAISGEAMGILQQWVGTSLLVSLDTQALLRPSLLWYDMLLLVLSDTHFRRIIASARSNWRDPAFHAALQARAADQRRRC